MEKNFLTGWSKVGLDTLFQAVPSVKKRRRKIVLSFSHDSVTTVHLKTYNVHLDIGAKWARDQMSRDRQRRPKNKNKETRKTYELDLASTELPKWEDFMNFLLKRCLILENIQANNATAFPSERIYKTKSFLAKLDPANCVICKQQSHPVFRCKKFNDLSVNERFNSAKRNNLCINCFSSSHKVALCKSSRNYPNCSKRHNSLLCKNFDRNVGSQRSPGSETLPNMEPRITTPTLNVNSECFQLKQTAESFENGGGFVGYSKGHSTMLLCTGVVYCQNSRVEVFPLRALLDSGSQSNLITHEAALALGLKCERVNTSICGVNGTPQFINNKECLLLFQVKTDSFRN
ncbi:integrase catalytic domain-containing protein [Trichonephila clavipes]|nr:integrase catalytic domain-containing protein [Trichonephila clavipes]